MPELVPDAGRLFIVAAPSAGKTFLAMVIAKAAAAVGRAVFLVLEEGGARATGVRFRNLGFDPTATVRVAHLRGFELADGEVRRLLVGVLQAHIAPILVLDPFSSIFTGNENNTEEMNQAKKHLEELVRANPRALLVLCHHTSKAGERGDGGPGMFAARGCNNLSGWTDVQLNLKHQPVPKGCGRVSFVATVEKNRDGERGQHTCVTISLGDGVVTYRDAGEAADHERAERIFEAATANPGLSKDKLATKAGGRKARTLALIDQLAEKGALEKRGTGYHAKTIAPHPEATP